MEKGIKETKELFKAFGVIAKVAGKVYADKKVSMEDLPHLLELAMEINVLTEGFAGLNEIPEELKDLKLGEVLEMVKDGWAAGDAYEAGRKS